MSSPSSPERAHLPPSSSLAIHLDLVGGLAGDMFVAAMVDALPALAAPVAKALAAVAPPGADLPACADTSSGGLRAKRFGLAPGSAYRKRDKDSHGGTSYRELQCTLNAKTLETSTREHALAILALLADAEARVHGTTIDDVHFHEIGDWDSLMDVVAAGCIVAHLPGARWTASTLPLGGGTVSTVHGVLPVPAPATSLLLEGYRWRDDGIAGERVTPTGAAILRHLMSPADVAARSEGGRLLGAGAGAGTRTLAGRPNIVRALVFERTAPATAQTLDGDAVAILEFDIDDMTGEEIAHASDRLRALPGVIDVSVGTRVGKKARPTADFRILAQPAAAANVAHVCFSETSTLGLRVREERRHVLRRSEVATTRNEAAVRVKVAERPGGMRTGKAEHDDVAADEGLDTRRRTRASAVRQALDDES